jgi:hypothetical protein
MTETQTFALVEAQSEKRREGRILSGGMWGLIGFFWIIAILLLLTPPRVLTWYRLTAVVVFLVTPSAVYAIGKLSKRQLFDPVLVPVRLLISSEFIEVEYQQAVPVRIRWNDPDARISIFEARYARRDPMRWLLLGRASIYRGIRLSPDEYQIVTRAAEEARLSKRVDSRLAKFPSRELTWTNYSRSG